MACALLWLAANVAVPGAASAADRAASSVLLYSDDDHNTVVKPLGQAGASFGAASLRAQWSTDFITAASVDLVSAASPGGFSERRHEVELGGGWDFGDGTRVDVDAVGSREPDFRSQSLRLSAATDWWQRRLTTALGFGAATAATGRVFDGAAWRDRTSADLQASASWVVSPVAALDVAYDVQQLDGYQASQYRYVRLYRGAATWHETAVGERVPDERVRQSWTARWRQRIAPSVFGLGEYRLYADSWGLVGHTASARASWTPPCDAWTITAEARGHLQGGAAFYQRRYAIDSGAPALRTADKELGPMWSALGGLHVEWTVPWRRADTVRIGAGADVLHLRYLDHPFIQSRTALLATVGVVWER